MTQANDSRAPRTGVFRLLTILYGCIGLVNLLMADFLGAGTWLSLAAAMLALGNEAPPLSLIPVWRRVVAVICIVGAVTLIVIGLVNDFAR
jgi:hypothetical protein